MSKATMYETVLAAMPLTTWVLVSIGFLFKGNGQTEAGQLYLLNYKSENSYWFLHYNTSDLIHDEIKGPASSV